jgi:heterodisulfide reductase subunit C
MTRTVGLAIALTIGVVPALLVTSSSTAATIGVGDITDAMRYGSDNRVIGQIAEEIQDSDDDSQWIEAPWPMNFFGRKYDGICVTSNGTVSPVELPESGSPDCSDDYDEKLADLAEDAEAPGRFGAKDVMDLPWKSLLDAYSCTECGRCTSVCPANTTGKLLSPRKIMMDTRDRLEIVGANIDKNGSFVDDGKSLLGDHIKAEEIQACNTCNACVEACPVLINPVTIITELRRYQAMEASQVPSEWGLMFNNIENNGAPWQFPAADRMGWADNLEVNTKNAEA